MPKIIENFYENNIFTFNSHPCNCVIDTIHETPGAEPKIQYKVMADSSKEIHFAYAAQKGLVKLNENGTIADSNILGSFIAVLNQKTVDFRNFFKEYGFLFPIQDNNYEEISPDDIVNIALRVKYVVDLMAEVSSIHTNYSKVIYLMYTLLDCKDIFVQTPSMEVPYTTCKYPLNDFFDNPSLIPESELLRIFTFEGNTYPIYDSVINKQVDFDINAYQDFKSKAADDFLSCLKLLYVNYNGERAEKEVIDVLYHAFNDYGKVAEMSEKRGVVFANGTPSYTNEMKTAIKKAAQYFIGQEINANLSGIYPHYNTQSMEPSWKVDSLLSALYFSIFYIRPNMELYRQCANPRCGRYFLVKTTSTRTKYCSPECCNRVTQDTYRKRQRTETE